MPLCHALVYALSNPCISTPCWNLLELSGLFGLIELSGLFELIWVNFSYLN